MLKISSSQATRLLDLRLESKPAWVVGTLIQNSPQTDRKIEIFRSPEEADSISKPEIYCWAFSFGRSYAFCM